MASTQRHVTDSLLFVKRQWRTGALTAVLSELRILASKGLDARQLLCVVLVGDARLPERLPGGATPTSGCGTRRRRPPGIAVVWPIRPAFGAIGFGRPFGAGLGRVGKPGRVRSAGGPAAWCRRRRTAETAELRARAGMVTRQA
jgi:hypothetical protein